ncbi:MAG: hypothetical protein AAGD32_14670, partial [Planctomycetota bacterium]
SVADVDAERHAMSRAHAAEGDNSKSEVRVAGGAAVDIEAALKEVHGEQLRWVALSYSKSAKDHVEFAGKGAGGVDELRELAVGGQETFDRVGGDVGGSDRGRCGDQASGHPNRPRPESRRDPQAAGHTQPQPR